MTRLLVLIAMIVITVENRVSGFYLLSNSLEEGIVNMSSSLVESDALNNYCQSCKWGEYNEFRIYQRFI